MISEQLRVTLLSLKQISDRLKLLNNTSVTKSEALAYKNEIIEALGDIDFTEITEALDSIDGKIDDISTELEDVSLEATSQEILTAVENINVESADQLAQFFGLPQALPEYQPMTEGEIKSINNDVWLGLYGYGVVKNTLHYKNFIDEVVTIDTYFNSGKTYADYGYASLWSAHDVTVDVNSNPVADAEIYTYNPPVE